MGYQAVTGLVTLTGLSFSETSTKIADLKFEIS
jgi:hypothetical protein